MSRLPPGAPRELEKYLTPQERLVFILRRHWFVIAKPIGFVLAGLVVVLVLNAVLSGDALIVRDAAIWAELAIVLWAAWQVLDWWHDRFVATDRRLLLTYGIITRKVAMMPMSKVTDMSYNRTVAGRLFGYGEFVLESAGQDQALSRIAFVPNPDFHYRVISTEIFTPAGSTGVDSTMGIPFEAESAWWRRT